MAIERIMRMIFRRTLNRGINAGVRKVAQGGKSKEELTPEDRARGKQAQKTAKRARQAMRLGRRIGRF